MRNDFIPYGHQWIDDEDIQSVVQVLKGDWITQGSKIKEFEEAIAKFVGARYAVALSSGTAALHAACFAGGIGPKDQVITTPITFAATSNCILYVGGIPVFADIKEDTCNIDPVKIIEKIDSRTKAIIPVDFAGQPADLDQIQKIARDHNLIVIEDACHALGAEYKGKKIGSLSDLTIFSFHPVKHITTGEGGMVTTNHGELYEKLLMFRNHGITRDRSKLIDNQGPWYYEMQGLGYNYRITDFQCALGLSQSRKIEKFINRRREIAEAYNDELRDIQEIILPYQKPEVKSAWHIYVIRLKLTQLRTTRIEVFEALRKRNIGVNVHYIPVYNHPYYHKLGYHTIYNQPYYRKMIYQEVLCPNAEKYYEEAITLPLFPKMTDKNTQDVIKTVRKVLDLHLK